MRLMPTASGVRHRIPPVVLEIKHIDRRELVKSPCSTVSLHKYAWTVRRGADLGGRTGRPGNFIYISESVRVVEPGFWIWELEAKCGILWRRGFSRDDHEM